MPLIQHMFMSLALLRNIKKNLSKSEKFENKGTISVNF